MNKEDNKVNFDLSQLSLNDLIILYDDIGSFLDFLKEKIIIQEEKKEGGNE